MNNEELQQLVFESLGGCSWEHDLDSGEIIYSEEFWALLGYMSDEVAIDARWVGDNIHPEDIQQWRDSFIESVKGLRRFFDCELRYQHKQGHYIWIQTRGIVVDRDSQGRARRIIGIVFDISERKASKGSETRFRMFLDNIPDALSLKDREGRYIYVNRQFESWLGKPSHQIYGLTAEEIFHPEADTLHMLRKHEKQVWEKGRAISEERRFPLTRDGKFRHAVITKFPVFDEAGKILAIGTTNTDITERYYAQEELRQSEKRYRQLFDSAPAVLIEGDWSRGKALIDRMRADGVEDFRQYLEEHPDLMRRRDQVIEVVDVNHEALRVFQVDSLEEFRDLTHGEISDDQRQAIIEELITFANGEHRTLVRTFSVRSSGEEFPVVRECELFGADPDDWSQILVTVRDTSGEEAVRQSEARYRKLFESAPVVLAESDWTRGKRLVDELRAQGVDNLHQHLLDHPELLRRRGDVMQLLSLNQEAVKMYRAGDEKTLRAFLDTELSESQHLSMIEDLVSFADGKQRSSVRTWTRRADGEQFPIIRESELQSTDPGDWSRVLITIRDDSVTEAVRMNERRYRQLFEAAPAVLCETDWSAGKALVDELRRQGVVDLKQHLIDHPELIQLQSQVMRVMKVNHEAQQVYRADSEQQLILYAEGELNETQRRFLIEELCNLAEGQRRSTIQGSNWRLDGEEFPVVRVCEVYGSDSEDWSQVLLSVRDISAEEAVRQSEERYRRLFESAPAVLGESDWTAARNLVDDLRAQGIEDIPQYLIDHPELTRRREDFMKMIAANQEAQRVFRADSSQTLINFLNRPLEEEVRLGIIGDLANFLRGERRSTIRTWVPSVTGDKIPIVRDSELYGDDPEDWSEVLISIRDISKEEAVRMSEIRFRRLFESAPAALYESDWSKGKQLVDRLLEQGVSDIRQYLLDHPELIKRRDDVHRILNANQDAISMFRSRDKESHIDFVEGDLIDEQREALIEVLDNFSAGRRRSLYRTITVRETGERFPIIRNCELISSDRDDWSLVLISIQDISVEVEAARKLEAYQEELRSLAGKISLAEESERRRISSELHDGTIQNLVLARIHLANLKNSIEAEAGLELADSINDLLETSLKETRSLIFEISPPVLYELGLEPAVEWLAEHYRQRTGIEVTIASDDGGSRLSDEMNIVIFQTARELLVNIAKHADAQHVSISWQHAPDHVVVTIEDDGVGFDVEAPMVKKATEGGFGLFAVRERLKLLGAELDIQSSPAGSVMRITAPVHID